MKIKLFISYSSKDTSLVDQIAQKLYSFAEIKYWNESKELGEPAWEKIEEWIDGSEATIVIITDNTVKRGLSVGKEVGISKAKYKKIIPFVSKSVPEKELGFLGGITYEKIDLDKPNESVAVITKNIEKFYDQKQQKMKIFFGIALLIIGVLALTNE